MSTGLHFFLLRVIERMTDFDSILLGEIGEILGGHFWSLWVELEMLLIHYGYINEHIIYALYMHYISIILHFFFNKIWLKYVFQLCTITKNYRKEFWYCSGINHW